jgi:hypothetical protein
MTNLKETMRSELKGIIAQAYCTKENEQKELDATLLIAIEDIIFPHIEHYMDLARKANQ